jgi:hypothetical protein
VGAVTFCALAAKKSVKVGSAMRGVMTIPSRRNRRSVSDYEVALSSENAYSSLWQTVRSDLHERDIARDTVINALDQLRLALREAQRSDDEEAVSDVLDSVYGFAPARSRL